MSKTGVQSDSKDGGFLEPRHESKNTRLNFSSLANNATYLIKKDEQMIVKSDEALSTSSLSSEAENYIVRISPKSVVNDADFGGEIKTIPNSGKRISIVDNVICNFESSKHKINDNLIRPSNSNTLEFDGLVGDEMLAEMGTDGVCGVGTETMSLPLPIALDTNYLVSDFSDNLKDFVFSVSDGDNLSKVDSASSFAAVDNTFSALLGSEDSITDSLHVSLYDDSDPVNTRNEHLSGHVKEDPTMTSVIAKRSEGVVMFPENELLNFTSLKSSTSECEKPVNVKKIEPMPNVFHSNSITNSNNFFLTLKSDDSTSPCKFSTTSSSFSSPNNMVSLSNINGVSSNMNVMSSFIRLDEQVGSLVKVEPDAQGSSTGSLSYSDNKQIDSTSTAQQMPLSNQNVNVTTISISNKENNSIKILVNTNEGQNMYVINSSDLNLSDGKNNGNKLLNENKPIFVANTADMNQSVRRESVNIEGVLSDELPSAGSEFYPSASVSGLFLVPVRTNTAIDNQISSKKVMMCNEPGCNKTFKKASKLKVHKMLHTGERPFKCTYPGCIWAFTTPHKLKRHLESHEGRKDFICDYPNCGHKFTTIYNLNTHRKLHQRPCNETCPEEGCSQAFHTKRQLEIHLRTVHGVDEKTFKCPKPGCEKVFYSPGCMGSHMRVHAQSVEDFKCKFEGCNKEFTKLCRLRQHEKMHTGEKPYICNYEGCSWAFATASKLKRHETKHTGVRKWQCHICRKFFQRSEHLKGHLITHSGDRPFACPVEGCGNAFTAKSSLYVHLRKHDESGKTIVYQCPMKKCDRHYASKASLRQHILLKHCTVPEEESQPQGVINWLNLLGPNDPGADTTLSQDQLSHSEVLAQTALTPGQDTVLNADFLTGGMADQTLLNTSTGEVVSGQHQPCSNLMSQLVVVSTSTLSQTPPSASSLSSLPPPSSSSSLSSLPAGAIAAQVVAAPFPLETQQQLQQQVIGVGEILQERMSVETLEKGKKTQFVMENMQGSARTDDRSNEFISHRAFKRWQKQKEIEAAKLRAHLEAQSLPVHSTTPALIPRVLSSAGDLKSPDSSNVSLASQANTLSVRVDSGNNATMIFKEIPDMELQAEGIQGSVLNGGRPSAHGDSFMTELFIKDPETGMTYRQTQLLQDDPPTLCLLEDMGEVEPSHNVVLDAGLEGNLMEESLSFQDLE